MAAQAKVRLRLAERIRPDLIVAVHCLNVVYLGPAENTPEQDFGKTSCRPDWLRTLLAGFQGDNAESRAVKHLVATDDQREPSQSSGYTYLLH
jgi:hypothetical protein